MRSAVRFLGAILSATLLVGLVAAPASAQARDPFDPLVTEGSGSAAVVDEGGDPFEPNGGGGVNVTPTTEGLAETGFDSSGWLFVAYVLLALGTGALVLSRNWSPLPHRRSTA